MKTITYNEQTHRLVPVEPTVAIRIAIYQSLKSGELSTAIYRAMLSAAPQPEPVEVEPVALIDGNDECVLFPSDVMFHYWIGRNCTPLYTAPPDYEEIKRQRDELVKALEKAREEMSCANFNSAAERIDHALASVKGGAA